MKCYTRVRRHGDPTVVRQRAHDRLLEMIADPGEDCIIWENDHPLGYGSIYDPVAKKARGAHVLALESVGPHPAGLDALHGPCHNPSCVNPRHLSWGTHRENMADRVRDGSTDRGSNHYSTELDEATVMEMKRLLNEGHGRQAVADRFGTTYGAVAHIDNGTTWAWLEVC